MKKLDLTVCMREKEYGQALARGLAYITPNLDITVCDAGYGNSKMAPGSVIITDDRGLTGENILQLDQILPAGEILEQAACIWHKISGEVFIPETEGTVKIWKVASCCGGSGTTVISLAMARLLAAEGEKRILYLNAGPVDDYVMYVHAPFEKAAPKRRFIFHVCSMEEKIFQDRFAVRDGNGVYFLKPEQEGSSLACEGNIRRITDFFRLNGYFTDVMIDAGKNPFVSFGEDIAIEVINGRDCRTVSIENGGAYTLINFAEKEKHSLNGEKIFYIPKDTDSFSAGEDSVEISMNGIFAAALEKFIEKIRGREHLDMDWRMEQQ